MPNPETLPVEIVDIILQYITEDEEPLVLISSPNENVVKDDERVRTLYDCALIDRNWHKASMPKLYERYIYRGAFDRLWLFLRTISERPDVANYVKVLAIRSWSCNASNKDRALVPRPRSKEAELKNLLNLGQSVYDKAALSIALEERNSLPFLNLLILALPQVSSIYFMAENKTPCSHPFATLVTAISNLSNITDVAVFGSVMLGQPRYPSFSTGTLKPILALNSLRKLELFDVNLTYNPGPPEYTPHRMTGLTHLTIVSTVEGYIPYALRWFLHLPKDLVHLTLYLSIQRMRSAEQRLNFTDIWWPALRSQEHSLEYFDFVVNGGTTDYAAYLRRTGYFKSFTRLQTLRCHDGVLLLNEDNQSVTRQSIDEILPPTLISLTLYDSAHFEDYELPLYLIGAVGAIYSEVCPKLKYLLIEDVRDHSDDTNDDSAALDYEMSLLQKLCKDLDVVFAVVDGKYLPHGGQRLQSTPEAHDPEAFVQRER